MMGCTSAEGGHSSGINIPVRSAHGQTPTRSTSAKLDFGFQKLKELWFLKATIYKSRLLGVKTLEIKLAAAI